MEIPWLPRWEQGRPAWTSWSVEKAIKEGYRAHGIVYICNRRLSVNVASIPWLAKQVTASGDKTLEKHPAADLLRKPNPWWSWQDIMEVTTLDLNLGGNAYWYIPHAGSKFELYRLRPDRIKPVGDPNKVVSHFEYKIGIETIKIPVRDDAKGIAMVHFRLIDPGNDLLGLSPLQAASRVVDTDNAAIDWNRNALENQARPPGAYLSPNTLTDAQYARLKEQIESQITGAKNARKPLLLEGGMSWQQHGFSPTDMDFLEGRKFNAVEICNIFGVRPEWVGLIEAKFENARQARRMTWEDTIIPFCGDIASTMNLVLAPLFGEDIYFAYDLSRTPAVTEARSELIEQAKTLWGMGVPFNEINEELGIGFEPIEGGDVGYLPLTLMPVGTTGTKGVSASTKAALSPQTPLPTGERRALPPPDPSRTLVVRVANVKTEEQRVSYWRAFDRRRQAWEEAIALKVQKRFREERDVVLEAIEQGAWEVSHIINGQKESWQNLLLAIWQAVFEDFGKETAKGLGMEIDEQKSISLRVIWNPWPAAAKLFASQVVGDKVVDITETTKAAIKAEVIAGQEAGEATAAIAKRIKTLYDGFNRHRSFVIARTEVGGAANYGTRDAAKQSGVVHKHTWVSSRDARVRDSHQVIDGQSVPMESRYSNGLLFPSDPAGAPEEVINCRCVETFETPGFDGEEED